ncbi:MAG: hypothetical protein ACFB0C_02365 [Leptolyngbyaceae cyanobacterium]
MLAIVGNCRETLLLLSHINMYGETEICLPTPTGKQPIRTKHKFTKNILMPLDINLSESSGTYADDFVSSQPKQKYFVPICPNTFMVNRSFLHEYIPELINKKLNLNIVIGDYLERHNYMFFYDMNENDALTRINRKSKKVYETIKSIVKDKNANESVQLHSFYDYIETEESRHIGNSIRKFKNMNESFAEDFREQSNYFLNSAVRKLGVNINNYLNKGKSCLEEYLIEEIQAYICLYQNGFVGEIYPGKDLNIFEKMTQGKYDNFPFDYSDRTYISVNLSTENGNSYAKQI